jgi:hypothetical protein
LEHDVKTMGTKISAETMVQQRKLRLLEHTVATMGTEVIVRRCCCNNRNQGHWLNTTMTSDHTIAIMTLDVTVAFYTTVVFVIPFE